MTLLGHQFFVIAHLGNAPFVEQQNEVRVLDNRQTVGDYESSAILDKFTQGLADKVFRRGIHAGSGIIEEQDTGVHQQSAGYSKRKARISVRMMLAPVICKYTGHRMCAGFR